MLKEKEMEEAKEGGRGGGRGQSLLVLLISNGSYINKQIYMIFYLKRP